MGFAKGALAYLVVLFLIIAFTGTWDALMSIPGMTIEVMSIVAVSLVLGFLSVSFIRTGDKELAGFTGAMLLSVILSYLIFWA